MADGAELRGGLPVLAFAGLAAWDAWLAAHPGATGAWLRLGKGATPSVTRAEAIDAALCHGWIDGRIDPLDEAWYFLRFTPRARRSRWSQKNRARAEALVAEGRMAPAGQAAIDAARADGRWDAAYPSPRHASVPDDLAAALAAAPGARAFFDALDGSNRYAILHRIHAAVRADTRARRIAGFAAMCAAGETIYPRKGRAAGITAGSR